MSSISQPRSSRRSSAARTASQHSCVVGCSPWLGLGLGLGFGWSGARSPVPKAMPGCRVSVGSDGETCRGRGVGRVRVRVRARVRGSGLGLRSPGGCGVARRLRRGERWSGRCARAAGVRGAVCGAWRAGGSGSSARPDLSAVETKSAGQKRQCGDRSSRNRRRRAASGRGAARRCQCRFGCERCPPTRAACRRILSLTPRQYGGAPACWHPSLAATFTVRRSGVSRDGPEGAPNERTAPQTAWEPRRPPRWRRLPAALARSTK